jgi:hypothetical protein
MPLTVAFMIGRDVWERKRGRAVAQYGAQPVLRPFDTENLCWQATVWRSGLWLRVSMAFHGHVACVELAPGASTSSTDHSHAVLRLVQYSAYMYLSITKNLPRWTKLVRFLAQGPPTGVPRSYRPIADYSEVPCSNLH